MTALALRPGGLPARPAGGSARGTRTPLVHPALRLLAEAGVAEASEVRGATVRDLSRAHPVWAVALPDGRRLVVKSAAPERGFDLGVEFLVYRMAVWCDALRAALPAAALVDEDRHLLVLEDLASASLALRVGFPGQPAPAVDPDWLGETVGRLGAALGAVHRGTAGLPLPPARPPLALVGFLGPVPGTLGEHCAPFAADPLVTDAARALAGPVAGCLVSHDMKWDNVVPRGDGVALLDWELAGSGDPAIDLGFLLAEHLAREGVRTLSPAARALLASYADAAAVRPGAVDVLARRTALASGLRLAQLCVELASGGMPDAGAPFADLARAALRGADDLTAEVASCLRS